MRGGRPLERAIARLLDNVDVYRQARDLARGWRPDLIYERYSLCAVAGSLVARRLGVPHFLEVNAPLAEEEARFRGLRLGALTRRLERWILRRADRVIVVSSALAAHARRLGVPDERILTLPNAVDPRRFRRDLDGSAVRARHDLNGSFVVGFSGTLKPWHGVHHLVGALATLAAEEPRAHLLLIGDGPERERIAAQAARLGLADRVCFTGNVGHAEMGEHLAACDVLVAPYGRLDNHWFSPLKVAEYRAVGRPVVASAIGQLAETLDETRGVCLVPPEDEASLAAALVTLAREPDRRATLGRAAADTSDWTWEALARRLLAEGEVARRKLWGWSHA
jgi:glycosyltransferase involved in cell wall biosynthesis